MDATLNTQEDNIQNVLSAMMNDLPEGCLREGLEGSYSYTGQTPKHKLKVTHGRKRKFVEEPGGEKDAVMEKASRHATTLILESSLMNFNLNWRTTRVSATGNR